MGGNGFGSAVGTTRGEYLEGVAERDRLRSELRQEAQSHDAEINRIAVEVGLQRGSTIEDIIKAIRQKAPRKSWWDRYWNS
jgi:hypothetical protein